MILTSSNSLTNPIIHPLLTLQPIRTNHPHQIRHEAPLELPHKLLVPHLKLGSAQPMQRLQIMPQNLPLVRTPVLHAQHERHVIGQIVEARAEVHARPVEETNLSLRCEVDIAHVRVAVQEGAETRVAVCAVAVSCESAARAVEEMWWEGWAVGLGSGCCPGRGEEVDDSVVVVFEPWAWVSGMLSDMIKLCLGKANMADPVDFGPNAAHEDLRAAQHPS